MNDTGRRRSTSKPDDRERTSFRFWPKPTGSDRDDRSTWSLGSRMPLALATATAHGPRPRPRPTAHSRRPSPLEDSDGVSPGPIDDRRSTTGPLVLVRYRPARDDNDHSSHDPPSECIHHSSPRHARSETAETAVTRRTREVNSTPNEPLAIATENSRILRRPPRSLVSDWLTGDEAKCIRVLLRQDGEGPAQALANRLCAC